MKLEFKISKFHKFNTTEKGNILLWIMQLLKNLQSK